MKITGNIEAMLRDLFGCPGSGSVSFKASRTGQPTSDLSHVLNNHKAIELKQTENLRIQGHHE